MILFSRIKHWCLAQGRHGTHSPFVYAFVEQVLRSSKNAAKFATATLPSQWAMKEWQLLIKTIAYLRPTNIFCSNLLTQPLNAVLIKQNEQSPLAATWTNLAKITQNSICIVTQPSEIPREILEELSTKPNIYLLVLHPHAVNRDIWQQLSVKKEIKMELDFWHWGLLSNHSKFKARQQFKLK